MTNHNSKTSSREIRNYKLRLISLSRAADICPYEQGYLSLLARRGELKAKKIGRNWHTTIEWLNEYLSQKRPEDLIRMPRQRQKEKNPSLTPGEKKQKAMQKYVWILIAFLVCWTAFWGFRYIMDKINSLEEKTKQNNFIPEDIMKIPNEDGGFNVYGVGRMKIGEEESIMDYQ